MSEQMKVPYRLGGKGVVDIEYHGHLYHYTRRDLEKFIAESEARVRAAQEDLDLFEGALAYMDGGEEEER